MIPELPIAMLACARIGAPHTVVFGGFSRRGAVAAGSTTAQAKVLITADGGWRRGKAVGAQGRRRRGRWPITPDDRARPRRQAHRPSDVRRWRTAATSGGTTSSIASPSRLPARAGRLRAHALPALHLGHDGQAQGHHAHDRGLPARHVRSPTGPSSTSSPTTSTGARPTSAGSPATATSSTARWPTRRRASCTRARPTPPRGTAGGRSSRSTRSRILYCAPTAIRAFMKQGEDVAARSTTCRRCACSGRVGEPINPEAWLWYQRRHRRRQGAGRRHVVADRDGHDHDHAAAGRDDDQARLGHVPVPGHRRRRRRRRRQLRAARRRRLPRPDAARGRRCCAASTATRSATRRPTGAASRASTSPATAPSATRRATTGCSAASTTS